MNKTEINERLYSKGQRAELARMKKSTGENGKLFEILARSLIKKYAFSSVSDFRARTNYGAESDFTLVLNGKRYKIEFKTGAGELGASETFGKAFFDDEDRNDPDSILVGVDVVVYLPCPSDYVVYNLDDVKRYLDEVLDKARVFSKSEFIDFIVENSGKRKHSLFTATKFNRDKTCINIQSTYLPQLAAAIRHCNAPTYRDFLKSIGRL